MARRIGWCGSAVGPGRRGAGGRGTCRVFLPVARTLLWYIGGGLFVLVWQEEGVPGRLSVVESVMTLLLLFVVLLGAQVIASDWALLASGVLLIPQMGDG